MSTLKSKRVRLRSGIALTTALALSAGASVLGASAASAAPTQPPIDTSGFDAGRYIVVLDQDPLATYRGGLPNLARTAPLGTDDIDLDTSAADAYAAHLESEQSQVASAIGADIAANLTTTMNGFIADLSREQALELSRDARVSQIFPDEIQQIQASPANEYLDLEALWAQAGGVDAAGEGVVVGVLDTGIAPENPLFAGDPLGTTPGAEPYLDAQGQIVYEKGDGNTFTGVCQTGAQFEASDCSTKIVSARYYVEGFGVESIGTETQVPGEYLSPRDGDAHGSHTASTAAGNANVPVTSPGGADLGTMSGVAPEARIAAYKVCWSGPDPTTTDDDGCSTSDSVQAIEQATEDGVDVINFSIGGGAATSVVTADDIAFLGAAAAGVFVSVSAGNDGPGASTLDHGAPWYTTVAAASVPNYEATVVLPGDVRIPGGSVTVPMGDDAETISGEFIYAGDIPAAGVDAEDAALCQIDTLDEAAAAGKIVLCDRGVNARAEKSQVVADAGGIATVLVNVTPGSIDLDDHAVPTIHVDAEYRDELLAAADGTTVISFEPGNTSGIETVAPVVAGFSSRGPVLAEGSDVLKPDVAAPGVGIIAAGPNPADGEPSFEFLSGTSMAAPHVAGLGAIYLGVHPNASPAEVKSALMTTATDTRNLDGTVSTDPWAQGAGFVNTQSMLDAGLIYEAGTADWYGYLRGLGYVLPDEWVGSPIDASDLNQASIAIGSLAGTQTITRSVTSLDAGTYTPSVQDVPGVDVEVSPSSLAFTEAGQTLDYTVTFTTTTAELGTWSSGFLTWTSAEHTVRSPIAVQPVAVAAPVWVEGMGTVGETPITAMSGIEGTIGLEANGLAPFSELGADTGAKDESFEYEFSIPEGELVRYFSLDAADDTSDLDLFVYLLDDEGNPIAEFVAGTGSADEELLLDAPVAGDYVAYVDVFAANEDGTEASFTLDTVGVAEGQQEGQFRAEPSSVDVEIGDEFMFSAKWNGLDVNSEYLGIIEYSGTDVRTFVRVTTGDATMPVPERLAGDDRYETAVEVSQQGYPDGADVVYVASGENFPDGLAAAPAAAHEGGPLLLTSRGELNDVVMEEVERLSPDRIVIVGGEPSVSPAVADALEPLAAEVVRLAGADRYETSRLIAAYAFDASGSAFMATGRAFPDALTAGSAAGSIDAPVILVDGKAGGLDDATVAELDRLGVQNAYLMGDQQSMSNGIELQLDNAGLVVNRFGGSDRFDTAVLVNRAMFDAPVPAMYIASGEKFPDALAASALAAAEGSPLYLSRSSCVDSAVVTESLRLDQPPVYLLGDEQTLSAQVAAYAICP